MNHQEDIVRIKVVYRALEDLGDKVVFVGGATVLLYRNRVAEDTRPTDDIDIVVELAKYADFTDIEEQLRKKGFANDIESGVICRYIIQGIIVDIMPTQEKILGFKNTWYPDGFKTSMEYIIDDEITVRIFRPEYFIASKLEAFKDRGKNDGRTSTDFEDIVYVLNNRTTIWDEIENATENVKTYLKGEFLNLLEEGYLYEWISAHLEYNEQKRVDYIVGGLNAFCA